MIADQGDNAVTRFRVAPLRETDEFHVVVLKPFRVPFAQGRAIYAVVIAHKAGNPLSIIGRNLSKIT